MKITGFEFIGAPRRYIQGSHIDPEFGIVTVESRKWPTMEKVVVQRKVFSDVQAIPRDKDGTAQSTHGSWLFLDDGLPCPNVARFVRAARANVALVDSVSRRMEEADRPKASVSHPMMASPGAVSGRVSGGLLSSPSSQYDLLRNQSLAQFVAQSDIANANAQSINYAASTQGTP